MVMALCFKIQVIQHQTRIRRGAMRVNQKHLFHLMTVLVLMVLFAWGEILLERYRVINCGSPLEKILKKPRSGFGVHKWGGMLSNR